MSPVYHCPPEVLSEIFSYAICQPMDPSEYTTMVDSLVGMYCMLHDLFGVCTAWKNAALAHGYLWSTIPIIPSNPPEFRLGFPQATRLNLERARNADLHLVGIIRYWSSNLPSIELTRYARQFRTINIVADHNSVAGQIAEIFGGVGTSSKLSEISIHHRSNGQLHNARPYSSHYVVSSSSAYLQKLNQILKSLSVFRLRGAPIYLDQVHFLNRLVELNLQEFTLGYDSEITKLMTALASATELRSLKIISITTFPNPEGSGGTPSLTICLPKLESLLVQDLYANTLKALIRKTHFCAEVLLRINYTSRVFRNIAKISQSSETNLEFQVA